MPVVAGALPGSGKSCRLSALSLAYRGVRRALGGMGFRPDGGPLRAGVGLGLLCLSGAVLAQEATPGFPAGLRILPAESTAVADEGHSYAFNPAGAAFTRPASFEFYQTFRKSDTHVGPGDVGRGLYLSFPGVRFGFQYTGTEDGPGEGILAFSQSKLVTPSLAVGTNLSYHYFVHTAGSLPGVIGLRLGFLSRPTPNVSVGMAVDNILSPDSRYSDFRARARFGVGVRPLGDRLTLSADLGAVLVTLPTSPEISALATAGWEPWDGVKLHATFEVPDVRSETRDFVVGLGANFRFSAFSLGDTGFISGSTAGLAPMADAIYVGFHGRDAQTVLREGGISGSVARLNVRGSLRSAAADGKEDAGDAPPLLLLTRRLRSAMDDPKVHGVLLMVDDHEGTQAELEELRRLVVQLRAKGKPVVAYLFQPRARDLYLASACNLVLLHPASNPNLEAPRREVYYLKGLLDKLGVQAEVVRQGAYKSRPEQYVAREPSAETKEMMTWLLKDLQEQQVAGIAEGRKLPRDQVEAAFGQLRLTAGEALAAHLVDELRYPDDLEPVIHKLFGRKVLVEKEARTRPMVPRRWGPQVQVGVVYLDGGISRDNDGLDGLSAGKGVASREVVKALNDLAKARTVKAVVLRIDSPGGEMFAVDEIWRAVEQLRRKKPVVVSMAGVAASGGYYVSAPADVILADAATLTGSIGVFGLKFNAQALLGKLDVQPYHFAPSGDLTLESMDRPWSEAEQARLRATVEDSYQQFIQKVAAGRKLTKEQVDAVGRGRVFTGRQALEHKLVDGIGGLDEALELAKARAKLKPGQNVMIRCWPERSLEDTLVEKLVADGAVARVGRSLFLRLGAGLLQAEEARLEARTDDLPARP